ncbi:MAG: glycosyltransferase [bacterium]|nr:glycosyltransferase [bacterium]
MTLSVVVISFNQLEFIKRLVSQLLNQDFQPNDYEIIVVECYSQDGSADWLKAQVDPRVRPILLDKPCNRSAGRNRGIVAAQADIIVMIDGDHTVERDFLSMHSRAHQRGVCAIVGKSVFARNPEFVAINNYLNNSGATKLSKGSKLPGRYFLTRNCSVSKGVLLDIGLFDESFDQWGGRTLTWG